MTQKKWIHCDSVPYYVWGNDRMRTYVKYVHENYYVWINTPVILDYLDLRFKIHAGHEGYVPSTIRSTLWTWIVPEGNRWWNVFTVPTEVPTEVHTFQFQDFNNYFTTAVIFPWNFVHDMIYTICTIHEGVGCSVLRPSGHDSRLPCTNSRTHSSLGPSPYLLTDLNPYSHGMRNRQVL